MMSSASISKVPFEKNLRIVIIGAGLAGLACALHLYNSNFSNITILEAQNNVGGRVSTINYGGYHVELGAQWVHGANNALCDFSKAHKLLPHIIDETSYEGKGSFYTSSGNKLENAFVEEVKDVLNFAKMKLEEGCYDSKKVRSVMNYFSEAFDKHMKNTKHKDEEKKKLVFRWYSKFEGVDNGCDCLSDIAVQSFTEWEVCPEDMYHIEFSKGFSSLVNTLIAEIPQEKIFLNSPVKKVNWHENLNYNICDTLDSGDRSEDNFPVMLECENGEKIYADCAIITTSVGFLKEKIDSLFSPPLPENKRNALEAIGFGTVNKIFLVYKKAFWSPSELGFQLVWEEEGFEKHEKFLTKYPWITGITGFDVVRNVPNILLGWIAGEDAIAMERSGEKDVLNACSELLRIFLKRSDLPKPVKILRSSWYSNPYIRGSYSNRKLDYYKNKNTLHDLQHPLCSLFSTSNTQDNQWPSVLFAGEALDENAFSSAHGAFHSGVRTANLLINVCSYFKEKENVEVCSSESESNMSTKL